MDHWWRKSRPTSPASATPTPTPTSPTQSFIQKKLSALHPGDVRTIAAPSIAIGSIGSPFLSDNYLQYTDEQKATHTSRRDHDAIGQEPDPHLVAWQTAYSAAKIAVDIAKESSGMLPPLKAVVGAISVLIKNYDRTVSNTQQVEAIQARVLSLSDILKSPTREGDHSEKERRELLCGRLMNVVVMLEPLSEQNGLLKFLRNEDYAGSLNGFVQDIAYAVTAYQTSLGQNTYENTRDIQEVARNIDHRLHKATESAAAAEVGALDKLNSVDRAGYQGNHHERCLSGTRESTLKDIMRWAKNPEGRSVFWLNGLAGTGKSTIAQTFSEMANDDGILGASFFCSRDYLKRKELKNIFPTLAYQLACRYPLFRNNLIESINRDPSLVKYDSLVFHFKDLVVDPLSATGISCVIVIDALDECIDDEPASAILSVLDGLIAKIPRVKFFITGRPEPRIRYGFRLLGPSTQIVSLHEAASASVEGDIRLYLAEKLGAMAKRWSGLDLPEVWPSDEDITILVRKSSGLFIFASTVVRFIKSEDLESEHLDPNERLRLVTTRADNTNYEGEKGINSLYSQVLRDAFSDIGKESVFINLKRILSSVVLALNPLSRDELAKLLDIDSALIRATLRRLHSVVLVPADGSEKIRIFHKSFPDFLQDSKRCPDPRFHIDSPARHGDMVLSCLDLVGKLRMNPCSLPPFAMNRDIPDPLQPLKDRLGSGLRYACKYWSIHLLSSSTSGEYGGRLVASASRFFDHSVFPWMEVMSLEGCLEDVIHSMNHVLDWLSKVGVVDGPLRDLTMDCLRFILRFFRPIRMSAQHIYHTALPLSPVTSLLRLRFLKNHPSWEEDWTTQQASFLNRSTGWGGVLRVIEAKPGWFIHMAVVGQRIVAVCEDDTVNVYDAVTGTLRLMLKVPSGVSNVVGSPDGSILSCAHSHSRNITLWDMQTGGRVHTFTTKSAFRDIAVSLTGRYLTSCSFDGTFEFWDVGRRCEGPRFWENRVLCACWLEPENHIALGFRETIMVVEVTTGSTLHTFSVAAGRARDTIPVEECVGEIAYSAGKHRLAACLRSGAESRIVVIDIWTGLASVSSPLTELGSFTFSDNGDRVFCASGNQGLRFFDVTTPRPQWYSYPIRLGSIGSVGLLRSGHLVVNLNESIQLLATEYAQPLGTSLDPDIYYVYPLDSGRAICAGSSDSDDFYLLDTETMETVANYHVKPYRSRGSFPSPIAYASLRQNIVALCFPESNGFVLRLHVIGSDPPRWTSPSKWQVFLAALSPDGKTLITVGGEGYGLNHWEIYARKVSDGGILGHLFQGGKLPRNIGFTTNTQFYVECAVEPFDEEARTLIAAYATPEAQFHTEDRHADPPIRTTFILTPGGDDSHPDIRRLPGRWIPPPPPYGLNKYAEWVLDAKLRRVCWLPPGYAAGINDDVFFVGSSIVMGGEDGILRKLTFREPRLDS